MRLLGWILLGAIAGAAIGFLEDEGGAIGAVVGAIVGVGIVVWLRLTGELKPHVGPEALRKAVPPRTGKWIAIVAVAVAIVVGAWFAKDAFLDEAGFVWRDAAVELRPVKALKGVAIGDPLPDVVARVGAFDPDGAAAGNVDPADTRNLVQSGGRVRLRVLRDRVMRVSYECGDVLDPTRVNRVACGASASRVIELFGGGARMLCAKVDPSDPRAAVAAKAFAYDVVDTGTRYVALDGRVRAFIVMEPRDLEEAMGGDLPWQRCE